jgi:serine/threonine-protein kinase
MKPAKKVDPRRDSTPATGGEKAPRCDLPPDLLKQASGRLGLIAILGVVLWIIGTGSYRLALRAMGKDVGPVMSDWVAASMIVASLLLFWYTRRSKRDPRFILDLGLVYLVVTAFALGMIWHSQPHDPNQAIEPQITWAGVLVLMFAAILPNFLGRTLVAGLLAASMLPIGMLIARARGLWQFADTSDVILMHYPDYMMVGISLVIARVVMGLGQQVAKARDLGSYELDELLGEGGMGQVYRATHRMLARPAAIKLIRPEMLAGRNEESDLAIKRFKREALVAANLRSPHTVELYDFGVTHEGTFYFVMELLQGMTLDELVRRTGMVPPNRVIYILKQVCESLDEAHARGLVHRDIKPPNIHLGQLGLQYDFAKVLDFGLVKATNRDEDGSMATAAGLTPGTPAFMAPEMAMGDPVDGRADLYALGCVAYYLLTGVPVFTGDTSIQVMAKHLNAQPVPPSERAGIKLPKALEKAVLACLAKKPDHRPGTAGLLAKELGLVDVVPWTAEDAAAWWKNLGSVSVSAS